VFSSRLPADLTPNRLTAVLERRRQAHQRVIDLTLSNPTRAGIDYPADLLAPLAHARGLVYRPQPLGLPEAREAVAADYARRGVRIPPDRIALTASSSEAYSVLFKLFCEPGAEVLVPRPSYPLFEHLARLDAVTAVPYDLEYHGVWSVNMASLARAATEQTRIILAVSPNNPTGSYLKQDELAEMEAVSRARRLPLVVDEVFADYPLSDQPAPASPLTQTHGLTLGLGGFSKSIGLPQAKLGWIAAAGPEELVIETMRQLEFVCDTYLSVSTPVQAAAAELFARGAGVRSAVHERVRSNHQRLRGVVETIAACRLLDVEGGWYGTIQVPTLTPEDDFVVSLLETEGVLVHPGFFFDFPRESFLVLSLLPPPADFDQGVQAILRHLDCTAGRT
jgi:alanine-synthesizing transaminase